MLTDAVVARDKADYVRCDDVAAGALSRLSRRASQARSIRKKLPQRQSQHRTLRRTRALMASRLPRSPSYEELREAAEDHDRQIVSYAKCCRSRPSRKLSATAVEIGPKKTPSKQQRTICTVAKLPKDGLSCSQLNSGYTSTKYKERAAIIIGLRPMRSDSKPESGVITIMQARLIAWARKA